MGNMPTVTLNDNRLHDEVERSSMGKLAKYRLGHGFNSKLSQSLPEDIGLGSVHLDSLVGRHDHRLQLKIADLFEALDL